MTDVLVAMRVIRPGTNDTGYHPVGDVITVDAAHAAVFEEAGFAERLEAVTDAAAETPGARRRPPRTR
jgi:hypothetical protein